MSKYKEIVAVVEFLGDEMTEEKAQRLFDQAKRELSQAGLMQLAHDYPSHFYYLVSEYAGEIGGFELNY